MPKQIRFLLVVVITLTISLFVTRLGAVLSRYRSESQKFADLPFEALTPADPTIVNDADSPRPDLTLSLQGRAIKGLDDGSVPWMTMSFNSPGKLVSIFDRGRVFQLRDKHIKEDRREFEFPQRKADAGTMYGGDVAWSPWSGGVIATVGEFPVVQFWDVSNGKLIATIDDQHPTIAAQPIAESSSKKHASGLRYSDTGARRITASPSSCLFAIGKMDGTIELWGDLKYMERPEWLTRDVFGIPFVDKNGSGYSPEEVAAIKEHEAGVRVPVASRKYGLLMRKKVHEGEVVDLKFCEGGLKLMSVGGHKVTGYEPMKAADGQPAGYSMPVRSNELVSDVVVSEVGSLNEVWRQKLDDVGGTIALPVHETVGGPHWQKADYANFFRFHDRPFAVLKSFSGAQLGSLKTGQLTGTITLPKPGPASFFQGVSFHRDQDALLTLHTEYAMTDGKTDNQKITTVLSLWQVGSKKRISTARFDGQFMAAGWNRDGMMLGLLRFDHRLANAPAVQTGFFPWETYRRPAHLFHLWDLRVMPIK